jgi:murein DD-endopeptidase MepM/ murein hydrolase activator NlpD
LGDGIVEISKTNGGGVDTGYGHYIVVQYNGFYVICAHLAKLGLPVGSRVVFGQEIARTGNTGKSTGPHLHLEIRKGKVNAQTFVKNSQGKYPDAVDPETFVIEKEWESILRKAVARPEDWIKFFEENKNHPLGKFLPDLIIKIKNIK